MTETTENIQEQQTFTTKYEYDTYGNNSKITYPSGYAVTKGYENNGYPKSISSPTHILWQATAMYANGQYAQYKQGSKITQKTYNNFNLPTAIQATGIQDYGLTWDNASGTLTQRKDNIKGLTEDFGYYDILKRLTSSTVNGTQQFLLAYQKNGNIDFKTGVGEYVYKYSSTRPHAVEVLINSNGTINTVPQTITYTPFNKTEKITEWDYKLTYTYGTDQQRKISELKKISTGAVEKTIYYSGNYEEITVGSDVYKVHYITSPTGLIAINVKHNNTDQLYYVYTDHLGSIIALTDDAGTVVYEQNFDAWGRERNPNDWTYTANTYTKPEWLIRGFTGHEHLNTFALINMNGRCYDPVLGRMLSPDNYVQDATGTQTFNRYSYALNNPLVYTDPDGDNPILIPIIIGAIAGGYTGYKIADANGLNFNDISTYGYILGGAAIGAVAGYAGGTIAAGGGFMANTASIAYSSTFYSMGMANLSGGMMQPSVSFGFGSYNFGTGEFRSIFDWKDLSTAEKIGYSIGSFANLSDIYGAAMGAYGDNAGEVDLVTKNDPIGHSELRSVNDENLISVGPDIRNYGTGDSFWDAPGTNEWETYAHKSDWTITKIRISNVRVDRISEYAQNNLQNFRYQALNCNCVTSASNALLRAGVLNIPFLRHPSLLQLQMFARQNAYYTSYMYNFR